MCMGVCAALTDMDMDMDTGYGHFGGLGLDTKGKLLEYLSMDLNG